MQQTPFRALDGTGEPRFALLRVDDKHYEVNEPFLYLEPKRDRPVAAGGSHETGLDLSSAERRFRVPKNGVRFITDLASIPPFATWLVPKDGRHTPAALLHDSMMPRSPTIYDGPTLDRVEADRIFRNAMQHLGVPFIRRWMIWSAVSLATFTGGRPRADRWHEKIGSWLRWIVAIAAVGGALFLGASVWADLLDRRWPRLPVLGNWPNVPWMGARSTCAELGNAVVLVTTLSVASGALAGLMRLLFEMLHLGGRRSWLRATTFLVLPAVVIPFAVPLAAAAAGWALFQAVEFVALLPQIVWHAIVNFLGIHLGASRVDRFRGPINVPLTGKQVGS